MFGFRGGWVGSAVIRTLFGFVNPYEILEDPLLLFTVRAHTDGQTDGQTLLILLSPCFAKALLSVIKGP